jgi:hypothetical protein
MIIWRGVWDITPTNILSHAGERFVEQSHPSMTSWASPYNPVTIEYLKADEAAKTVFIMNAGTAMSTLALYSPRLLQHHSTRG